MVWHMLRRPAPSEHAITNLVLPIPVSSLSADQIALAGAAAVPSSSQCEVKAVGEKRSRESHQQLSLRQEAVQGEKN